MSVVTLTTDFGIADYAAGLLNGVIWCIAPDADIVTLSHDIPRHDVLAGAMLLERSLLYFPDGTVHVYVIDPGVGTQRRAIAVRLGQQYFVGPDNGLITLAARRCHEMGEPVKVVSLDRPEYWLEDVSHIFHGRDVFSPVGAHLARGVPLTDLGTIVSDPVWLDLPSPTHQANGVLGHVIHVDHFGNLATDIRAADLPARVPVRVRVGEQVVSGLSKTFADGQAGELVALIDSSDHLSVCVVNGSAAQMLEVAGGGEVSVAWVDADPSKDAGEA